MGFTMLFCLGEESLAAHIGERRVREELPQNEAAEQEAQDDDVASVAGSELGLERKESNISQVAVSVVEGEDEDIKVVQVGLKDKSE